MLYLNKFKNSFLEKYGKFTLIFGTLLLLISFAAQYSIADYYNVAHANEKWIGILVNNYLFPLAIFLILYHFLYHESIIKKILGSSIMVNLGNATYSFYLLHTTFVLSYIYKFLSTNTFVAFLAMLCISYVFHRTIEQPLATLIRRKFSKEIILSSEPD
jgi:peptidoglycan/LPS O-acetylase OafA/YrhL